MEPHTHTSYWKKYITRWKAAMEHHHRQLAQLIETQDLGRIQLHALALRLIAENDYEQYRTYCEEAEHNLNPVESWQIEWQD